MITWGAFTHPNAWDPPTQTQTYVIGLGCSLGNGILVCGHGGEPVPSSQKSEVTIYSSNPWSGSSCHLASPTDRDVLLSICKRYYNFKWKLNENWISHSSSHLIFPTTLCEEVYYSDRTDEETNSEWLNNSPGWQNLEVAENGLEYNLSNPKSVPFMLSLLLILKGSTIVSVVV